MVAVPGVVDTITSLAQDHIVLGLAKSPGMCRIRKAGTPRKWDIRDGYGFSGASTVFHGIRPSQFEVDVYCWTETQIAIDWKAFELAAGLKRPPVGALPLAIGIGHPVLNELGITMVVVEDLGQWEEDDYGGWQRTIKFLEWRAPLPALAKTLAGVPASTTPAPSAQDALDQENAARLQTLESLAGGG